MTDPPKTPAQVQAEAIYDAVNAYMDRKLSKHEGELAGALVSLEQALNAAGPNALSQRIAAIEERLAKIEGGKQVARDARSTFRGYFVSKT